MTLPFLDGEALRPVELPASPFDQVGLALGQGRPPQLEVLVLRGSGPQLPRLRSLWKDRHDRRPAPLLAVVLHGDGRATLCGPTGDDPPTYRDIDQGQADRLCREALAQPDRHAALRFLRDALPAAHSDLPGVRNEGFLATHELVRGAPQLPGWDDAGRHARPLLKRTDADLLRGLGFTLEAYGGSGVATILRGENDRRSAVAVVLLPAESAEVEAERFGGLSPVSYAMAIADRENLPYVLVCHGPKLRLYPVGINVGVGRRGRTETFIEVHTTLLRDDHAAYLWHLFSHAALAPGGTVERLLAESRRYAGDLATRLRERVYDHVVPALAQGLADARRLKKATAADLADTYRMAMTVLFRLLFVAYAEDKNLLPYEWNGLYQRRSLKTKATELLELHRAGRPFAAGDGLWEEVDRLCRAVEGGNSEWGVPAYGGDLFARDPEVSRPGSLLAQVSLPNAVFGPVLHHLLLIDTEDTDADGNPVLGPVDFRSLGVREFGTIYEGLLESELAVAETDLTVDREGFYRPARTGDAVTVRKGAIYLHNRSGARKASGTYFTKEFAVDHLLDQALEPALKDHLGRLDADPDTAAEQFFDFRIADIAMGSAHFLVAAVDRVERAFTGYLSWRLLPGVRRELAELRNAARTALGSLADQVEIEDTQLLRRLIARRCVYGVDVNPLAVTLARLSIWIHTFVPGLPLSLLDHNLVAGNSLVGIGRVDEIAEAVDPGGASRRELFPIDAERLVGEALEPLQRVAKIADTTLADVTRARKALAEAREAVRPAEALCDIVTACRITGEALPVRLVEWDELKETIAGSKAHKAARKALGHLPPFHFPVAFPEVFLRPRSGFDLILGNPPWEKARVEEHGFWARHQPGLRSLSQREYEQVRADLRKSRPDLVGLLDDEVAEAAALRQALLSGAYPGMGTGDPDLYKAFCWRFWHLIADDGGRLGIVLPRSALAAKGSADFREAVFAGAGATHITMLVNNRQWVFDSVHPQYTIGLVAIRKGGAPGSVSLLGPFNARARFDARDSAPPSVFPAAEVAGWTDTASLPLLPSEQSLGVFAQMRRHPRLDLNDGRSWRARPYTELHATNDKHLMDLKAEDKPRGFWPVFKGESFDIWEPDRGTYYAWADPKVVLPELVATQKRGARLKASPFSEFPPDRLGDAKRLPCQFARIAFRDVTRATDSRTVRLALVPPKVFLNHLAPCLLFPRGTLADVAYLLGVLSSIPLDWYSRRFVETHLTYAVLNPFPVPRPAESDLLRRRVVALAGRLAAQDDRFAAWAEQVGVACGPLPDDQKQDHIHELDAVVAHLYGLTEAQLVHVFETFHEGWDYADRLAATLRHFRAWKDSTP